MVELSDMLGQLTWPALLAFGFLAGVISSLFGVGGGMVTTPLLNLLGMPMPLAVATSTPVIFGSAMTSTLRNRKMQGLNLRVAVWLALFMLPAVELSARLMNHLHSSPSPSVDAFVRIVFIIAVLVTTLTWLFAPDAVPGQAGLWSRIRVAPFVQLAPGQRVSIWVLCLSGVLAGFFAGFLGLGGARIIVPVLIGVFCMPLKPSVATSSAIILASSLLASVSYAVGGMIAWPVALALLGGALSGAWVGNAAMRRIETRLMRALYLLLSAAALLSLALKHFDHALAGLSCLLLAVTLIAVIALARSFWLNLTNTEKGSTSCPT